MSRERLSVVIVAFNKRAWTARCLASLLEATYRPLRLVVVDNGSSDNTTAVLKAFAPLAEKAGIEFTTLSFPHNVGSIMSRNAALGRCGGGYIAFLDNDTQLRSRGLFEELADFLERHPKAGIVTPKFLYPSPPYRIQCAGGGITREGYSYLIGRGSDGDHPEFNHVRAVPWCISACMVISSALARDLGPLDETYSPIGFEDTDYCFRARVRRRDVVYCPTVEIYHAENTTTFGSPTIAIDRAMARSQRIFRRKWRHMFPSEPSLADLPLAHVRPPRVPLSDIRNLPMVG
ncbi:MAG: glycosyltransferase family 2 protein [Thermoanaerobaculia bacterium]